MSDAAAELPRDFTKNPHKYEEFVKAYDPGPVLAAAVLHVAITAAGQLTTRLVSGRWSVDGRPGLAIPWLFCGLAIAVLLGVFVSLRRRRAASIPRGYWVQGTLQNLWLAALGWFSAPEFSLVLVLVLCASAFNDARYFYDAWAVRLQHLLSWPAFFLVLLLVDALGGPGIGRRLDAQPGYVPKALALIASLGVLIQAILITVGRNWYKLDARMWAFGKMQAQLEALRHEREVILRSCDFLSRGVTAGRFSHDVASPLATASLSAEELAEGLGALADDLRARRWEGAGARLARLEAASRDLCGAHEQLSEMTSAMARSLREGERAAPVDIAQLLEEARRQAARLVARHGLEPPPPAVDVEPAEVFVTADHVSSLANIMANGVLQRPDRALEVTGACHDEHFFLLAIRDFGVAPPAREAAIGRIRQSLSLVSATASADRGERSYDGYGIGLTLAKLVLVRHGGWLAVRAPEDGEGVVFTVLLPRRPPELIPPERNTPERIAESAGRGQPARPAGRRAADPPAPAPRAP